MARPIPLPAPVTRAIREPSGIIEASFRWLTKTKGRAGSGPVLLSSAFGSRVTSVAGGIASVISACARVLHVPGAQHEEPGEDRRDTAAKEGGEHHVLSAQAEEPVSNAAPAIAPIGPMALTNEAPVPRTLVGNDSPMKNSRAA